MDWLLLIGVRCSLQALLGENRQRYLDRLKERLARRERRLAEGLDPDDEDEETLRMLEEEENKSSGNILKDLQNRFDEEKDALLRRLRVSRSIRIRVFHESNQFITDSMCKAPTNRPTDVSATE